jgi:DNA-binding beta-propeller fold protein YncE
MNFGRKKLLLIVFVLAGFGMIANAGELQFEHVMNIGSRGGGDGQFRYVEDFAFDKNGRLLVTDAANSNIQVFDKTTGAFIAKFGGKGDDDNFEKPEGIAAAPDGAIFVADYTTGYIKKFDENHQWIKTFSNYGDGPGENIKSEFMDIHDGRLYMAEAGNHPVERLE